MHPTIISQIKLMKKSGLGYKKIAKKLNLPRSSVRYYLDPNGKEKSRLKMTRWRNKNPLKNKLLKARNAIRDKVKSFKRSSKTKLERSTRSDVDSKLFLNEMMNNPVCYLTGVKINLNNPEDFQLDHKIPKSRGGSNNVDNLGLCCSWVNRAKWNMTTEEFIAMCKLVVDFNFKS